MVIEEGEMEMEMNENHCSLLSSSSSLGRQSSSIYSLTLDEFQNSICDSGKNFGSMNMDEFLTSIWTAEENNQSIIHNINHVPPPPPLSQTLFPTTDDNPSLPRQPSLSLPAPLSTKTVDQVWSQIQKQQNNNNNNVLNITESASRQPTFNEMTLEDFLVKAGVVREPPCAPPSHYATNNNNNVAAMAPSFVAPASAAAGTTTYLGNCKRDCFGGSGYGPGPVSPANSSDGIDMVRGRKRMVDGIVVEKVVERRQRRMIKNRESAARSRARKQAYTVELEAELNQLKQDNAQLKQSLAQLQRKRKQQSFEEVDVRVQTKAQKAREKLRKLRRNMSCSL